MSIDKPLLFVKTKLKRMISDTIAKLYPDFHDEPIITYPPSRDLGDLSTQISFQIAYKLYDKNQARKKISEIADTIARNVNWESIPYISKAETKNGYINVFLDYGKFAKLVISTIVHYKDSYGRWDIGRGKKIIVEHTSANPIHPLHIGTARNAVLGDTIARIFKALGYDVETRFYINDMGRQVAYLVYGYTKVSSTVKIIGKKDHWYGALYSVTTSILEATRALNALRNIRKKIESNIDKITEFLANRQNMSKLNKMKRMIMRLRDYKTTDWISYIQKLLKELSEVTQNTNSKIIENLMEFDLKDLKKMINEAKEWQSILSEISLKWPQLYLSVLKGVLSDDDPEQIISMLMKKYEEGNEEIKKLFRKICNDVLEGFRETLNRVGITFDKFDWESDLVWSGDVDKVLKVLRERGWVYKDETGALFLDLRKALKEIDDIRKVFELTDKELEKAIRSGKEDEYLPPNLVLKRSDGTTLYTTRDIAYALRKFTETGAVYVYNVIGKDQTLPQKQLKAALYLMGYEDFSWNHIHVAYELVLLPGAKLSARRGRYVTFDEILDEAEEKAYEEIVKRHAEMKIELLEKISRSIAVGAVRYFLLSTSPDKPITFEWSRVLDFERNSGPFLQYTHARAVSILRKIDFKLPDIEKVDFDVLTEDIEKDLIFLISMFPEVVYEAGIKVRPNILTDYANKIAVAFNSFYQRFPVLRAETDALKKARLLLVEAFRITLANVLKLLGIEPLERM